MDKIQSALEEIQGFFRQNANPDNVKKYSRFFREGYDAYGVDSKIYVAQVDLWYDKFKSEFNLADFKQLFNKLLDSNKYEEVSLTVTFLSRMPEHYSKTLFKQIMNWLNQYFQNWAHVDICSSQVLAKFILNGVISHEDLLKYYDHKSKWVRRAVAVTTVYVFYEDQQLSPVLAAGDLLINDLVREVGQGVGWMLRDTWKVYPKKIEQFLTKHVRTGNRTAYQYACEKMDKDYRRKFRRPK